MVGGTRAAERHEDYVEGEPAEHERREPVGEPWVRPLPLWGCLAKKTNAAMTRPMSASPAMSPEAMSTPALSARSSSARRRARVGPRSGWEIHRMTPPTNIEFPEVVSRGRYMPIEMTDRMHEDEGDPHEDADDDQRPLSRCRPWPRERRHQAGLGRRELGVAEARAARGDVRLVEHHGSGKYIIASSDEHPEDVARFHARRRAPEDVTDLQVLEHLPRPPTRCKRRWRRRAAAATPRMPEAPITTSISAAMDQGRARDGDWVVRRADYPDEVAGDGRER